MVTVKFWRDEVYPAYGLSLSTGYGHPIEVDEATIQRWKRIEQEHEQMQTEIDKLARQNPAYFNGVHWLV